VVVKLREQLLFLILSFFTWIQDSESRLEVPTETIRFTCRKGLDFSGKSKKVFSFSLVSRKGNGFITNCRTQMLVKSSAQRLPLHKVLEHPWIVQNADPSGVYREGRSV
jgi:hypothetical protein